MALHTPAQMTDWMLRQARTGAIPEALAHARISISALAVAYATCHDDLTLDDDNPVWDAAVRAANVLDQERARAAYFDDPLGAIYESTRARGSED